MAEDVTQNQPDDESIAKAQNWIKEQVKAQLAEMQSVDNQQHRQIQRQQEQPDQLREILNPYIQPEVTQARLEARSAQDESRFYRTNPEAIEFEAQIESTFEQLMKAGRPLERADIYRHMVGRMALDDPEKFKERLDAKRKAQVATASSAVDFGFSAIGREQEVAEFKAFDKLPLEEMEKRLEGIVF